MSTIATCSRSCRIYISFELRRDDISCDASRGSLYRFFRGFVSLAFNGDMSLNWFTECLFNGAFKAETSSSEIASLFSFLVFPFESQMGKDCSLSLRIKCLLFRLSSAKLLLSSALAPN